MKKIKSLLAVILVLSIGFSLLACGKKVNLQTEKDAIEYLEDYVEEKDKWSNIATKLGLYYSVEGSSKFNASSYAEMNEGAWTVVLHGAMTGYKDAAQSNRGTFAFSYVATVTPDGQVTELFITEGQVTDIN